MKRNPYTKASRPLHVPFVLPPDVAKPEDILWGPTYEEHQLSLLRKLKAKWAREDAAIERKHLERLRKRATELEQSIAKDREWLARLAERQEEQKRVTDYWVEEQRKQAEADHKALLARLAKATKEIQRSDARSEREELLRRGVVRGQRNASCSSVR